MISLENIYLAKERIQKYIRKTEVIPVSDFNKKTGINLFLKLENFQNSGAFKMRGACNKIMSLTNDEKKNGIVCASAGNHAQGVAYSSSLLGIKSTIVMPNSTPLAKLNATLEYGGNVILHGNIYDEAYSKAMEIKENTGATFIHPFDDPTVIEGQATIALELLEQIEDLEYVFVSIGGGGILAGIAYAIKQIKPSIKVIGVQTKNAPAMKLSFDNKINTSHIVTPTVADGIAVANPGKLTFEIISKYVDDIITVSEEEIANSIIYLLEKCKILSEGAGATSVAGVISSKICAKGNNVVSVLSGGNIDISLVEKLINSYLFSSGRRFLFSTIINDKTGELMKIIDAISNLGANIVSINSTKKSYTKIELNITIDSKDSNHKNTIISKLNNL